MVHIKLFLRRPCCNSKVLLFNVIFFRSTQPQNIYSQSDFEFCVYCDVRASSPSLTSHPTLCLKSLGNFAEKYMTYYIPPSLLFCMHCPKSWANLAEKYMTYGNKIKLCYKKVWKLLKNKQNS